MKKLTARMISARLTRYVLQVLASGRVTLIAVTGSVGKTSAKAAIAKLLEDKYRLNYAEHSYNVPISLEMSFFGLELPHPLWNGLAWQQIFHRVRLLTRNFPYDVVVLEVNEDDFDLIEPMIVKFQPKIGVITGVAPAHMEKFHSLDEVTAQLKAFAACCQQVIYNGDFNELTPLAERAGSLSYGLQANNAVYFKYIRRNRTGYLTAQLVIDGQTASVTTQMVARQSLYSLLTAAAVGREMKLNLEIIAGRIAEIAPVRGRMNLLPAVGGARLIDDSYNSSPFAAVAALRTLEEITAKRKIAVLGSMNELGEYSPTAHREVGQAAARVADLLITIGNEAEKYLAPAAIKAGLAKAQVKVFQTPFEAGHYLKSQLQSGDLVLVKGSQNKVFAEEVSRIILASELQPENVLVRQSDSWKRKKKKAFAL